MNVALCPLFSNFQILLAPYCAIIRDGRKKEMSARLGFGLMRLPKENDRIKLDETMEMVDRFIDAGFTYFDTAYVYDGSEETVRKAITERYPRDRYTVASKMAPWKLTDSFRPLPSGLKDGGDCEGKVLGDCEEDAG